MEAFLDDLLWRNPQIPEDYVLIRECAKRNERVVVGGRRCLPMDRLLVFSEMDWEYVDLRCQTVDCFMAFLEAFTPHIRRHSSYKNGRVVSASKIIAPSDKFAECSNIKMTVHVSAYGKREAASSLNSILSSTIIKSL